MQLFTNFYLAKITMLKIQNNYDTIPNSFETYKFLCNELEQLYNVLYSLLTTQAKQTYLDSGQLEIYVYCRDLIKL